MSDDLLRVYLDPAEVDPDSGYPWQWRVGFRTFDEWRVEASYGREGIRIPDVVREQAGHRCVRCHHPFVVGSTPGRWSPCDESCTHAGPIALIERDLAWTEVPHVYPTDSQMMPSDVLARDSVREKLPDHIVVAEWRVLTVHHLNGIKHDCRWWNLVSLCQRCHLTIQGKVHMQRPWKREHSEWFKPYVAGFYASTKLDMEISRDVAERNLEDYLWLEHSQQELEL